MNISEICIIPGILYAWWVNHPYKIDNGYPVWDVMYYPEILFWERFWKKELKKKLKDRNLVKIEENYLSCLVGIPFCK